MEWILRMREGISIVAFTRRGKELADRLAVFLNGTVKPESENLQNWVEASFGHCSALIFIGATGIAVRSIAPVLKGKTQDPAVIVLDEFGRYVIPLLSGHLGGANMLAEKVALYLNGTAVITTATDLNTVFAIDLWAKKQGMTILQPERIRRVSAKLLAGESVQIKCPWTIQGSVPRHVSQGETDPDVIVDVIKHKEEALQLVPQILSLGIGCRKDIPVQKIESEFQCFCAERKILPQSIAAAASIDRKKTETGLLVFCKNHGWPISFYTAEELSSLPGSYTASCFVEKTVGVDNVCERSAVLSSGGTLLEKKYARNGISFALACNTPTINWEWVTTWENSS